MDNSILADWNNYISTKGEVVRGIRSDTILIDDTLYLDTLDTHGWIDKINEIAKSITLDFENENEDIDSDIDLSDLI